MAFCALWIPRFLISSENPPAPLSLPRFPPTPTAPPSPLAPCLPSLAGSAVACTLDGGAAARAP
uniref:Uncharacterized protein n=1 Tax=Setaria viridis TaxID=4556 RepID=A0A4V6DCD3_SETVI|nr:hypothetical protein SEVIR_2G439950v2 [Setaria viridis]